MTDYISFEDHQHLEGKWYYDIALDRFSVINNDCVTILGLPQKYSKYNDWGKLEDINDALFIQQTHPEDRAMVIEHQKMMINSTLAKEDTLINRWIRPENGQIITVSDRVIPVFDEYTNQIIGLRGILKRVRDSEAKKKYRPLARWRLNLLKMEFDYISSEIQKMYGLTDDTEVHYEDYLYNYIHIDDRQHIEMQRLKLIHGEARAELRNYRCIKQDTGEIILMNSDCFAVRDEESRLIAIEGWTWEAIK
jgi:hypothetical protein